MDNTKRFLDALERRDLDAAIALLDADVTWTTRMAADGSQTAGVISGRERVEARLRELGSWFDKISFLDQRISHVTTAATDPASVSTAGHPDTGGTSVTRTDAGGDSGSSSTAFVQTNGDFQTRDGRAYRNVYVFRFDWRDGRMSVWEEYANPVTIQHLEQGL